MRPAALAAAALVLAAAGGSAAAQSGHDHAGHGAGAPLKVDIGYSSLAPKTLDAVAGETVHWENGSARAHTVTSETGLFDSGTLAVGTTYEHRFETEGSFPYYCRLHPTIRGEVAVHRVLPGPPRQAAAPGRAYPIAGRAALPAGTPVTIEADSGGGFSPVAEAAVGEDGSFLATVTKPVAGRYRASAAGAVSPAIALAVLDRTVRINVRRGRHASSVRVTVTPPTPGGHVLIQLRLPERFGWWPVKQATLDSRSRAHFRIQRRAVGRAVLTLDDLATPLARSAAVRMGRR